eukprot:TRINITY_DN9431_c0_g1_i1.p1 TRINITY_DN9431_c0_g1~~TRINITY_DN9431_c0_g1_i1.p1  ORF type:complete len:564 (-),score=134.67 TRINITY_DN9431_c0_g1_i1:544-2235(-)
MPKLDCSEACGSAKGTGEFYIVDTKKVLCGRCIGRLHPLECKKVASPVIEQIDYEHIDTHKITSYLLNTGFTVLIALAFMTTGWTDNYFKGETVCPSINTVRRGVAHWDMNVFYWMKSSFVSYCDTEDSFWRLLMDGWFRCVVTSSDSWLLLFVTLPKAVLFKGAFTTLLQPVLGSLYACIAVVLDQLVYHGITEANAFKNFYDTKTAEFAEKHKALITPLQESAVVAKLLAGLGMFWSYFKALIFNSWGYVQKQRTWTLTTLSKLFKALAYAGAVRLPYRYFLEAYAPIFIGSLSTASMGQLTLEVVIFYYLSLMCTWTNAKIDKVLSAVKLGAAGGAGAPLTMPRTQQMRSWVELYAYRKGRAERLFASYKADAGAIGSSIDTVFTAVVAMRVLCILCSSIIDLGAVLNFGLSMTGFGGMLQRHSDWFRLVTGYDGDHVYYSEILATFGLNQAVASAASVMGIGKYVAIGESYQFTAFVRHAYELAWRMLLPFAFYKANEKWTAALKAQEAAFTTAWFNKDGGENSYQEWMAENNCHVWTSEAPIKKSDIGMVVDGKLVGA